MRLPESERTARIMWGYTIWTPLQHEYQDTLVRSYMRDKLRIYVRPFWPVDTLGGESIQPSFGWHIQYCAALEFPVTFEWDMPHDLHNIACNLCEYLDKGVAEILYPEIESYFNRTLAELQIDNEGKEFVADVFQVKFPPFEDGARRARVATTVTSTPIQIGANPFTYTYSSDVVSRQDMDAYWESIVDRMERRISEVEENMMRAAYQWGRLPHELEYLTQDEYEEKRRDWELEPDKVYLVCNNN